MSIQIGTLLIEMSANVARLQEDMNRATKVVDKAAHEIHKSWETVKTAFEAVVGFEFAKKVIEESMQSEQAANRLTVAYKLQGDQVGFTRQQLDELADSMAMATQFKDNDLKRGEAELLKFGNIYGDVFTRAMKLSADLAAFNGTDFVSAIDVMGKSLANPTEGVKGLGAAIGKLLPAQREHIKDLVEQNKGLEAQNYILDIVQKKIGGTSDLMNSGYTQAIADVTKGWDKMLESLGGIVIIKDTVVFALEAIAGALRGIASVFAGGTFSEGLLGKQTAMAKQITDLQDQLAAVQGRKGMTFTDDEGRVIGEDLRADELADKLAKLTAEYKKLYQTQEEGAKAGKPNLGLTVDQEGFLKSLRHQTESVGQGPIGGLFAKADELHLGEKTHLMIQKLGQDIQAEADQAADAKQHIEAWTKAHTFTDDLAQQTKDLQQQTAAIGSNAEEMQLLSASQKYNNEVRKIGIGLTGQERDEFIKVASALQDKYVTALRAAYEESRKWQTGFKEAMNTIVENSTNAAAQINGLFTNAFKGMEDALVAFTKTGKLDFKSLADSIITDLIRIRIQQSVTAPLASALGGQTGAVGSILGLLGIGNPAGTGGSYVGFGSTGAAVSPSPFGNAGPGYIEGHAAGGPIDAGTPYWVGEKGPELVVPRSSGTVIPNGQAMGGGNVTITQHISIDARSDQATIMAGMEQARRAAVAEVEQSFSRGGRLAKLVGTAKG